MNQPTLAAVKELQMIGLHFRESLHDYQIIMPRDIPETTRNRVLGIVLRAFPGGFRIARQTWTETPDSVVLTVFPR